MYIKKSIIGPLHVYSVLLIIFIWVFLLTNINMQLIDKHAM